MPNGNEGDPVGQLVATAEERAISVFRNEGKTPANLPIIANYVEYPALVDPAGCLDVMRENLGGEKISERDLAQLKTPAGGGINWAVQTMSGEVMQPTIEGIIVAYANRRAYWADSDPSGQPPDCSSRDLIRGVGNPGGDCEVCPLAQFGSGENSRSQACKQSRSVFVMTPGAQVPSVLSVAPASLKKFKKFLVSLPVPYFWLVCRFSLTRERNADGVNYSEIAPTVIGCVPPESIPYMRQQAAMYKAMLA